MVSSTVVHRARTRSFTSLVIAGLLGCTASHAFAQAKPQIDGVKILDLLVAKGLIQRTEADAIVAQATIAPTSAPTVADPDVQSVQYVPAPVRRQIKEELRAEVMQQAKAEGWAAPGQTAEWTQRIKLTGDLRVRAEGDYFGDRIIDPVTGLPLAFANFQAINTGLGFDQNGTADVPFLNVEQDRRRARIRARLGVEVQIDKWVSAEFRLATGNDLSPVSTNETLGSGAEFGKYQIWLDRASIQLRPIPGAKIDLGRSANPFWSTDLLFDDDLNFDGISARYEAPVMENVRLFGTVGAFPLFNTDFNFGSTNVVKTKSSDKFLLAAQAGGEVEIDEDLKVSLAAAYLDFRNVRGRLSSPCLATLDICDTDNSRPQFVQFGNTLAPIRNIIVDPTDPDGPQLQYYGLASQFRVLDVHGQVDLGLIDAIGLRLEGDFTHNFGYHRDDVLARGPVSNLGDGGVFEGGGTAWYANLIAGKPVVEARNDWNVSVGYKYLESDSVLDAITDSDFHLGGTNAKGFIVGGRYGIAKDTNVSARWLSANEVSGPPLRVDTIQIDLSTKF